MSSKTVDTTDKMYLYCLFNLLSKRTSMRVPRLPISCYILIIVLLTSCGQDSTVFSKVSSSTTNIDFVNKLPEKKLFNILYYLYYYNGGGVSAGDINNDGLTDLYFTANNHAGNKLYLNKGNFTFEDITEKAGVGGLSDWCTGSTMVDVNGDGYLDIYVSTISNAYRLEGHNELYINNRNNTFTESAKAYGLDFSGYSTQAAFFDYDRDGDLDCYLLNQSQKPHQNIVDTSNRRKFDAMSGDRFYRNELVSANGKGAPKFTDVSAEAGIYQSNLGYGLGIAVADFNNDGWDDVYIGNDFHENDYYYINNRNGGFLENGNRHFGHYSRFSMGNDAADFNNDGEMDIVTVDMLPPDEKVLKTYGSDENADIYEFKLEKNGFQYQVSRNCLQRNNGNGASFSETALISGIPATDWSWCPLFADFDNDGNKDLFVSSGIVKRPVDLDYIRFVSDLYVKKGANTTDKYDDDALDAMPDGSSKPFLFKGDGKLMFQDVSDHWGTGNMSGYFNGAAYADLDNDGDLDLVINALEEKAVVMRNDAPAKKHISITFKGEGPNTKGIGAKAYVFQKNQMQYQQLMLTRGFQSSVDARLHFGLDTVKIVDSLLIVWPDQRYQVLKNIPSNQPLVAEQKNATGVFNASEYFNRPEPLLSPAPINVNWQHRENDFDDFNIQYLIPHQQSTRGPSIATADVNGDGLEDFFVCGAKGQSGTLMIQRSSGAFSADSTAFLDDRDAEDVDAIFFDANNDKFPDLYVVSGGNQYSGTTPALADRLYVNDGKGNFSKSNTLPALFSNKSSAAVADIDHDGDLDVFTATLADAKAYGKPQDSHLMINDGKGNFSLAPQNIISLQQIGMVTSAAFADFNNDGWQDLVVAGEWMPVTVFMNNNGRFTKQQVPNSTGLWQTIYVDDINSDGHLDMLVGNWGWNTKYWSGKNGPLRLYVSDYDLNGQTDQLLSYTFNGEEYPFLAKDEVERSLPLLKKHYLRYAEYAGVVMKDVFYGWVDTIKPIMAERLGSAMMLGNGNGTFTIKDLPHELQLAPAFSFEKLATNGKLNTYIIGGNFFDVIPYEGKYDAQPLAIFSTDGQRTNVATPRSVPFLQGQVRDIKWLRMNNDVRRLVVAVNNDSLHFFQSSSSKEAEVKAQIKRR